MTTIIITIYVIALLGLATFGLLGFVTLYYYGKHRHNSSPAPQLPADELLPPVTIQLPIFNEKYVVERLINAAVALDYPTNKLQIQVVDDSTDDTTLQAQQLVNHYRQLGVDIHLLHRTERAGFKAGALAQATAVAAGEFIAIFDADFQPPPTFLRHTMPYFIHDNNMGMIQTRWGHLNDQTSPLTAAQAIAMDKHFMIEQTVRHRADFYPKFNGTAGIWRRSCVEDAGGWRDDTVCEDLCLSTRAILKGWDFQFLPDVVTPGELPASMSAYKNQQARWAKGSMQCLIKFGKDILTDTQHSLLARIYALLTMSGYLAHPFLITLILCQIPLILLGYPLSPKLMAFSIAGLGQPVLFLLSQQLIYADWRKRLRHFPTLMLISLGIGPAVTRALLQIIFKRQHAFIRTPKGQENVPNLKKEKRKLEGYRLPFDNIIMVEIGLALYAAAGLILAILNGIWGPMFLLTFAILGYSFVVYLSLKE